MAAWRSLVLTLFPEMFPGPLGFSLAGKALERGLWALDVLDIRDFARDKHRSVDDAPLGGGAGMVMRPDVVDAALAAAAERWQQDQGVGAEASVVYLSPRGRLLTQDLRSEEHTSELQPLMRSSYAVLCVKQKKSISIRNYKNTSKIQTRRSTADY